MTTSAPVHDVVWPLAPFTALAGLLAARSQLLRDLQGAALA
jgi:hypothetical protein